MKKEYKMSVFVEIMLTVALWVLFKLVVVLILVLITHDLQE